MRIYENRVQKLGKMFWASKRMGFLQRSMFVCGVRLTFSAKTFNGQQCEPNNTTVPTSNNDEPSKSGWAVVMNSLALNHTNKKEKHRCCTYVFHEGDTGGVGGDDDKLYGLKSTELAYAW